MAWYSVVLLDFTLPGVVWHYMALNGFVLRAMTLHCNSWRCMALQEMALYGMTGMPWRFMALHDMIWLHGVTWHCMVLFGVDEAWR